MGRETKKAPDAETKGEPRGSQSKKRVGSSPKKAAEPLPFQASDLVRQCVVTFCVKLLELLSCHSRKEISVLLKRGYIENIASVIDDIVQYKILYIKVDEMKRRKTINKNKGRYLRKGSLSVDFIDNDGVCVDDEYLDARYLLRESINNIIINLFHGEVKRVDWEAELSFGLLFEKNSEGKDWTEKYAKIYTFKKILNEFYSFFPDEIYSSVISDVENILYGEEPELFVRRPLGRHGKGMSQFRLKFRALQFVEYLRGRGEGRDEAIEKVADAFFVKSETIQKWKQRMKDEVGPIELDLALKFARNIGVNSGCIRHSGDNCRCVYCSEFGADVLKAIGGKFNAQSRHASPVEGNI